ncbi:hypothetical protein JCM10213_001807 [Rhodosporidiobolus nylandii]
MASTLSDLAGQAAKQVLAPLLIAAFISCLLCGILLSLTATYFARYPSDRLAFKILVGVLTISGVLDAALACSQVYRSGVEEWGNLAGLLAYPWQTTAMLVIVINVAVCQAFFAWRIWIMSDRKNWGVPVLKAATSCVTLGVAFCFAVKTSQISNALQFLPLKWTIWVFFSMAVFEDCLITSFTLYYLLYQPRRTASFSEVAHNFETNFVALVVQAAALVVLGTEGSTSWFAIFGLSEGKVYSICVVATLNARRTADQTRTSGRVYPSISLPKSGSNAVQYPPLDSSQSFGNLGQPAYATSPIRAELNFELEGRTSEGSKASGRL